MFTPGPREKKTEESKLELEGAWIFKEILQQWSTGVREGEGCSTLTRLRGDHLLYERASGDVCVCGDS